MVAAVDLETTRGELARQHLRPPAVPLRRVPVAGEVMEAQVELPPPSPDPEEVGLQAVRVASAAPLVKEQAGQVVLAEPPVAMVDLEVSTRVVVAAVATAVAVAVAVRAAVRAAALVLQGAPSRLQRMVLRRDTTLVVTAQSPLAQVARSHLMHRVAVHLPRHGFNL